jgi:opacity protein-like surface antigen
MPAIRVIHSAFVVALLSASSSAMAAGARDSGFEVGIRTGYAFSAGHLGAPPNGSDDDLGNWVTGQWPFWIDAGYRFNYSLYLGGFFQYGIGFVNDDQHTDCRNANVECSARDTRFGIMGRYHFTVPWQLSPWVGYGLGYEWGSYSWKESVVGTSGDSSWSGFEFMNLQVGLDVLLPHRAVIAPFISFSLGRFDNISTKDKIGSVTRTTEQDLEKKSMHEWILIGVRIAVMP